jgi:2-polyprenyl-6-methoxyphenol hydroxylase-like FAD-dependent oxidoreductase
MTRIEGDTSTANTAEVLIVGAGPAGLTMAIELARRGVSFRLIEKMPGPFFGSRGKGVQPRTQEIFDDMGIVDRIVAAGGTYPVMRTYQGDKYEETTIAPRRVSTTSEPYVNLLMVPQFRTEAIMRERLLELGHAAQYSSELIAFEQNESGISASIKTSDLISQVHARYLIGADGGRSSVRQGLGIELLGESLDSRAIVADVSASQLARDAWHRWIPRPDLSISLCPLAGTAAFQLQAGLAPDENPELTADGLTSLIAARTGRTDIKVGTVHWASTYTMSARLAARYRAGRVFLMGDAAHVHPPTGGQGLNTSVQDSYNLAWKLAAVLRGTSETLLDSYEIERRPVAAGMLGLATRLLGEMMKDGSFKRGRETQQLDLGYRESPLSATKPGSGAGPQPGDRAPDARCRGAAGQVSRLFDLYRGPHWTLLWFDDGVCDRSLLSRPGMRVHVMGTLGDIVDHEGDIAATYQHDPHELILIRPDGYVAARVCTADLDEIKRYLDSLGQ